MTYPPPREGLSWLTRVYFWLWLDWHGYCPKHRMRKFGKWCQSCAMDKGARKREKAARVEDRARRMIEALNDQGR